MSRVLAVWLIVAGLAGTALALAGVDLGDGSLVFPCALIAGIVGLIVGPEH